MVVCGVMGKARILSMKFDSILFAKNNFSEMKTKLMMHCFGDLKYFKYYLIPFTHNTTIGIIMSIVKKSNKKELNITIMNGNNE